MATSRHQKPMERSLDHMMRNAGNAGISNLTIHRGWRARAAALAVSFAATLGACGDSVGIADDNYDIEFEFSNGQQEWVAGFADYPVGKEGEWEISSSLAPLPSPLNTSRKGILLTGVNHSDDLFMYISREIPGLTPNRDYSARFLVTIATNAPRNCAGIGGAPGESVVLKVGGTSSAPQRIVDASQYYRATFDHGSQLEGGSAATPIGDISNSNANCLTPRYELKQFNSGTVPITIRTNANGRLWLIVGFDSGFEGTTAVYVTAVRVDINPL